MNPNSLDDKFITPEIFNSQIKKRNLWGPNGWILFAACNSGISLARKVKKEYERAISRKKSSLKEIPFLNEFADPSLEGRITKTCEDYETIPRLPSSVDGANVFVFQYVHEVGDGTPNENFMQLLQMIRTLKVHSAKTITAVTPYSMSSRQDRPTAFQREATLTKLNADLLHIAGLDQIIVYHPHSECIRGCYEPNIRFTSLNGLDLFIEIMEPKFKGRPDVSCVSADAGGAKLAIYFAGALNIGHAIASKYRPRQEETDLIGIVGMSEGKKIAIVGDDESVTVSSLRNVARELREKYKVNEIYMLISHNKIRPEHIDKLVEAHEKYGLVELHVTDTIPQTKVLNLPFVKLHTLERRFALVINRHHYNQSVSELFFKPEKE